jgi:hypothetical protein
MIMRIEGPNSTVEIDRDAAIVRKRFATDDPAYRAEQTRREYSYLSRFAKRLDADPWLTCPVPLGLDEARGEVLMRYSHGTRVDELLRSGSFDLSSDHEHVVSMIALALEEFLDEFAEPFHDFGAHNLLYDPDSGMLTVVDFTSRRRSGQDWPAAHSLEVSLGSFIGSAYYDTVRPSMWYRTGYVSQLSMLVRGLVANVSQGRDVDVRVLKAAARSVYKFTAMHGPRRRRAWYATAGRYLFEARMHDVVTMAQIDCRTGNSGCRDSIVGSDGTVEISADRGAVTKRFHAADLDEARTLAKREFDFLARFSSELECEPSIGCPAPLGWEPGVVRMSHARGTPIHELLMEDSQLDSDQIEHIGAQVARALKIYCATFDEPYFDLAPNNILYEPETGCLNFVDFTIPKVLRNVDRTLGHYEISLGSFIGYSLYYTVRPATWRRLSYWGRFHELLASVLANMTAECHVTRSAVNLVASRAYRSIGPVGPVARRAWYGTVGAALYWHRSHQVLDALAPLNTIKRVDTGRNGEPRFDAGYCERDYVH